jgi:hypothetical protein
LTGRSCSEAWHCLTNFYQKYLFAHDELRPGKRWISKGYGKPHECWLFSGPAQRHKAWSGKPISTNPAASGGHQSAVGRFSENSHEKHYL